MATSPNHFVPAMLLIFGLLATLSLDFTVGDVGVCYGRNGNNLLSPSQTVELYKRRNIRKMRTYDPDQAILDALRGSGIELNVAITNQYLEYLASSQANANNWVQDHVRSFPDVNFKYISVGNEVSPTNGGTSRYTQFVLPAMRNVYRAICNAGLANRIKISTSIGMEVVGNSYPPQDGAFRDDVLPYLRPILSFLVNTHSPLFVNVYPYFAYIYNKAQIDLGYALLEPNHGIQVNGVYYDNILYAMIDAVYAAVDRVVGPSMSQNQKLRSRRHLPKVTVTTGGWPVGGRDGGDNNQTSSLRTRRPRSKTKIVVTESGWPTHGGDSASLQYASTYNQNLIDVVDDGTPANSDPIEAYIFGMYDENEKPGADTERNFGLNYPNGQPKYDIDFN
ncbi:hypothetical protein C2S53_008069 [Perilla frutescens var. hirtella]|uniref:Uncharacterized protein n=1 Tax=Perilla frutescens var. hirtella TaxID=608512 RepID=A0AAD4P9K1_PERFH|nr:hypothetical protein C2S53_008069 [Perilla frutescens var. hirtella]